jgi:hypothetical protein
VLVEVLVDENGRAGAVTRHWCDEFASRLDNMRRAGDGFDARQLQSLCTPPAYCHAQRSMIVLFRFYRNAIKGWPCWRKPDPRQHTRK